MSNFSGVIGSTGSVEDTEKARKLLAGKIEAGAASARALVMRMEEEVPEDSIVRSGALHFSAPYSDVVLAAGGGSFLRLHDHALGQIASRAGIPAAYLKELARPEEAAEEWKPRLAVRILSDHYGNDQGRYLVRAVKGEVRGFLSDKFRRLDNRPILEAFATECRAVGAVPVDGTSSDTRVALKAIVPHVFSPVPGEAMAFGIEWVNSDFGNGAHAVRAFLLRLACLNGATMENAMVQIHLGRKLGDSIEMSERTYRLDTETSVSALRDVVRGVLAPDKIESTCAAIRQADERKVDWRSVKNRLGSRLLKGEQEKAQASFESQDVYNLPKGNTAWRASNALSWIANAEENPDRKLALERMAGELVDGRKDDAAAE
jgi:hypothetical protein